MLELKDTYEGERIGGSGGDETLLAKPGHVIIQIRVQRGDYFGASRVAHLDVTWAPLSSTGVDTAAAVRSDLLGNGQHVENPQAFEVYSAEEGGFISDFNATVGTHTTGDTYLRSFEINETMVLKTE